MGSLIKLETPLTDKVVGGLRIGDKVYISGIIYTARDAAHKKLIDLIEEGGKPPFELQGAIIYYVGPAPSKPGQPMNSAGPTTSYRMDPYSPKLISLGLKGMIGKGERGINVVEAMIKHKAVYFAATGGAAALIAKSIVNAEIIAYPELGAEAIRKLTVIDFPAIVAQDCYGGNLFSEGKARYRVED